jgi:membrane fusion protein, multidrug efflux system
VAIGRDYGRDVEVLSGVEASDLLVLNPADSLETGEKVSVKQAGAK